MTSVDTRNVARDSLFLFADLSFEGSTDLVRVKVRNLSAGGMMVEGGKPVSSGDRLIAHLRNVGEVGGTVAWVQGNRFGVAFSHEVDPKMVRSPHSAEGAQTPRYAKPLLPAPMFSEEDRMMRRI